MKKNLPTMLVLCTLISMMTAGCEQKKMPSPSELNNSVMAQGTSIENSTILDEQTSENTSIVAAKKPLYAISEKAETYVDRFGTQVIKKEYIVPYQADIQDIAPATITVNNIQYEIDSIVSPQNFDEKKITKEIVAKTREEAKDFAKKYEYNEADGTGTLVLEPNSVTVQVNTSQTIPSKRSVVKTYDMPIKDQNKIPQMIVENNIKMYLSDVSWQDMGDPGTGINATQEKGAYGTYNTVASSWRASATYSGTKYHTNQDYKGTATYIGKVLIQNSPTQTYIVSYKPNSIVANASGLYYNKYVDYTYQKENGKLTRIHSVNPTDYDTDGYDVWTTKVLVTFVILSFVFVGLLMYVAIKLWKRANDDIETPITLQNDENTEEASETMQLEVFDTTT